MQSGAIIATAAGIVALALGGAGVVSLTEATAAAPAPVAQTPQAIPEATPPRAPVETEAERRRRLNARVQEMLRTGQGARLTDEPVVSRAPNRSSRAQAPATRASNAPARASTPASARTAAPHEESPVTWTIAPPAQRVAAAGRSGGYRAPRLDLTTPANVPSNPIECLTQAIYYEARSESEEGQAAVAEVVLNRSRSGRYPADVCQVVYQRNSRTCQFTFTCDGSIGRGAVNMRSWARAERIAREVYEGRSSGLLPRDSVNYHADYVRPTWGRRLAQVRQIGAHIFYGAPLDGGSTPGAERNEQADTSARGGLLFVRNEALDRAYALMTGGSTGDN